MTTLQCRASFAPDLSSFRFVVRPELNRDILIMVFFSLGRWVTPLRSIDDGVEATTQLQKYQFKSTSSCSFVCEQRALALRCEVQSDLTRVRQAPALNKTLSV
jgi:hypothetical protein